MLIYINLAYCQAQNKFAPHPLKKSQHAVGSSETAQTKQKPKQKLHWRSVVVM